MLHSRRRCAWKRSIVAPCTPLTLLSSPSTASTTHSPTAQSRRRSKTARTASPKLEPPRSWPQCRCETSPSRHWARTWPVSCSPSNWPEKGEGRLSSVSRPSPSRPPTRWTPGFGAAAGGPPLLAPDRRSCPLVPVEGAYSTSAPWSDGW